MGNSGALTQGGAPSGGGGGSSGLVTTSIQTGAFTASAGQQVPCDTSGGPWTGTMPAAQQGAKVEWVNVSTSGSNKLTLAPAGADQFIPVGSSAPTASPGECLTCQCFVNGYWSLV
jgi:hypothetical protein